MAEIPTRIGAYEVIRPLRSGGMGTVYLGRDPELGRSVAIKVLRDRVDDEELLERFLREARAAAALRHPNIVTIYASGQHDHQPFIAMEFIDGESLDEIVRRQLPLTLSDRISYIDQLCAGLHFAHRAGIVHRDIKPANVMVDRDGTVRILDFGIARVEGSGMTRDGAMMGTLNYMSPEQMLGKPVDFRSDIFAVGAVAYELLCYQRAFKGSIDSGLLVQLPYEDPPPLREVADGVPPELDQIVMTALQKAPENRFRDLSEMRAALLRVWETLEREATLQTVIIPRGNVGAAGNTGGTHTPSSRRLSNDELGLRNQSRETVERHARGSRAAAVTDGGKTQLKPRVGGQRRAYAIAAAVLAVTGLVGTAAWLKSRSDSELTSPSTGGPNATVPSPTPVTGPNQAPLPSPATRTTVDPTRSDTTPVSGPAPVSRPGSPPTAPANTPVNTPVTAPPPSPPVSAPSSSNAALESTVQDVLARVTTMYTGGELAAALDTLSRNQAVSSDSRVAALASRIANAAFDTMASAEKTATSRNAAEVAGDAVRRGNDAKARAEAFQQRSDFVNAGLQALAAREFYQTAAADALANRSQPTTAPSPPAASSSASPAAAAAAVVQREQEGIVAAVGRFQAAYRDRDINALMKVYPSLRREARQKIEASFKTCRAYDVTFSDEQILIDPTNANIAQVTLRGTYACTVRTGQAPQVAESRDVFVLRKTGDIWIIERTGTIN